MAASTPASRDFSSSSLSSGLVFSGNELFDDELTTAAESYEINIQHILQNKILKTMLYSPYDCNFINATPLIAIVSYCL